MNTYRRLLSMAVMIAATVVANATPQPVTNKAGQPAPKPVSFIATPIHFPVDGKDHHPVLTVKPADATYKIAGDFSAKAPGTYTFTVTATGEYTGTLTCTWKIDAPAKAPKHPMTPEKAAKTAQMIKQAQEPTKK